MRHQHPAVAAALSVGAHRDRADHHQRRGGAAGRVVRHRPALDRADQCAVIDQCETRRAPVRALADAINGSSKAVAPERRVEKILDRLRCHVDNGVTRPTRPLLMRRRFRVEVDIAKSNVARQEQDFL